MAVEITTKVNLEFESAYVEVRNKENRLLDLKDISTLPYLAKTHTHYKEWLVRAKSMHRFLNYLKSKPAIKSILEIGCGNGWFIHQCSSEVELAIGVDINLTELQQADQVFDKENLAFYYWDIFENSPFDKAFDCIVFNASIQYFPDLKSLFNRLKEIINPGGEIHILDSPFYKTNEIQAAKERTKEYYAELGAPNMSANYFHHDKKLIEDFKILYRPRKNPLIKRLSPSDSPFGWYCFTEG